MSHVIVVSHNPLTLFLYLSFRCVSLLYHFPPTLCFFTPCQPLVLTMSPDRLRDRTESTVARHLQQYAHRLSAPAEPHTGGDMAPSGTGGTGSDSEGADDATEGLLSAPDVPNVVVLLSQLITQRLADEPSVTSTASGKSSGSDCAASQSQLQSQPQSQPQPQPQSRSLDRACAVVGAVEEDWACMQTQTGKGKCGAVGLLPLPPHPVRCCARCGVQDVMCM